MRAQLGLVALLAACAPRVVARRHSLDGRVRVEVTADDDALRVHVDGRSNGPYEALGLARLTMSADGRVVAWPVRRGPVWRVAINGREGPPFRGIGEVVVAPRTNRVAYTARDRGRWRVVVDGHVGDAFASVRADTLRWSPDGTRLAYIATGAEGVVVVVDGVRSRGARDVRWFHFGDKGARTAWVAAREDGERPVIDGREGDAWRAVRALAVAPAGTTVAWVGLDANGATLLRDGVAIERTADAIDALTVSDDGSRLAWARVSRENVEVVRDGAVLGRHADVEGASLRLSANGARALWVAVEDGHRRVFVEGVPGPVLDEIAELSMRPDGRWSCVGRRGEVWTAWVDGRRVRRSRRWLGGLVLAPVGPRWALFEPRGGQHAVFDDRGDTVVGQAMVDSLTFDASGSRWGCIAGDAATRRMWVLHEGGAREPFEWEEAVTALEQGAELDGLARALVRATLTRP